MFSKIKLSGFIIVILLVLYLGFPSGISTADGWYYAASVKYMGEIFLPHHLLYNTLGLVFCWFPSLAGVEVISTMKVMNALFAFLILIKVRHILDLYKLNEKQAALIIGLAGLSFPLIRFATENETYIVPLFFALIASHNYLKYLDKRGIMNLIHISVWASVAILFHQIYIFWWLGLLIGVILGKRKIHILLYILISIITPLSYLIVIMTTQGGFNWESIFRFIYGDFNNGARLEITSRGFFFSFVNLFRSFVQIHGYMFNMVRENLLLLIPGVLSFFFVVFALLKFPVKGTVNISRRFLRIHVLILTLQYIFAVVSGGNAEFMVMIPVLVFILFPFYYAGFEKFLFRLLIGMAIWNISYGLIPLHYKNQAPEQFLCKTALSVSETVIIASDDNLLKNMIYYQTGNDTIANIYKSPAMIHISRKDTTNLDGIIFNALNRGVRVYTNCLDEKTLSRLSIIEGTFNREFFSKYETVLTKSWKRPTGTSSVYMIKEYF